MMDIPIDLFPFYIISTWCLGGLVLGLSGAFILSTLFGVSLTRRRSSTVAWTFGGILALTAATISGLVVYFFIGLVISWTGPDIYRLSGEDLSHWSSFVSTTFNYLRNAAILSSYMGAIAGQGMGYSIEVRSRAESTNISVVWAALAISLLLTGLVFILLQPLLFGNTDVLYFLAGFSSVVIAMSALYQRWKALPEPSGDYLVQSLP